MTQEWKEALHRRIASAVVQARRDRSAQWVSDRTEELGHRVSRDTISNFETGRKRSLDLAELVVIAAVLGVPPIELIYPPDIAEVDTLPGVREFNYVATQGFTQSRFYDVVSKMIDAADRFERQMGQVLRASQDRADAAAAGSRIGTPAEIAVLAARSARRTGLELEALYNEINRAVWPGPIPYEGFRMAMDIVDDDDLTFPIEGGSDG